MTGAVPMDHSAATSVGFGTVNERHAGSTGAPPLHQGISHEVRDLARWISYHALG